MRDRRRWRRAAWFYRAYVALNPRDAALQVQLGNCLKEASNFPNAARAYERALTLNPDDSQTRAALQFVRGVPSTRVSHAVTALKLEQVSRPELMWIDITDIMVYFYRNSNINGIQRVILAFICKAQVHDHGFASDVRFCQRISEAEPLREIAPDALKSFIDGVMAHHPSSSAVKRLVKRCRGGVPVSFQGGDVFLILGAFWIAPRYDDLLDHLKQQNVVTGLFVYDLIPVTHSQFVNPISAKNFKRKIADILARCDFSVAISEFVAREVQDFVQSTQQRRIAVAAVPLAHELPAADHTAKVSRAIAALGTSSFALCVSTLEPRKNQAYLIEIWQKLYAARGETIPKLILVGRWGWGSERLSTLLRASRLLGVIIEIHTDINDAELAFLYGHCAFSLMPSLVEGWGLPIGESLGHGKPCFASSGSSMPEVGGEFVRYFDPLNVDDGLAKITEVLDHPDNLASWKSQIANDFKPRSWQQFSNDLVVEAWALARSEAVRVSKMSVVPCAVKLDLGAGLDVADASLSSPQNLHQMFFDGDWGDAEPWGRWAESKTPRLRFRVGGVGADAVLRVALQLQLSDAAAKVLVTARSFDETTVLHVPDGAPNWHVCSVRADECGMVDIKLRVKAESTDTQAKEQVFLGLRALMVADAHNMSQRFLMLEAMCD